MTKLKAGFVFGIYCAILGVGTASASPMPVFSLSDVEANTLIAASRAAFRERDLAAVVEYTVDLREDVDGVEVLFIPQRYGSPLIAVFVSNASAQVEGSPRAQGKELMTLPGIAAASYLKAYACGLKGHTDLVRIGSFRSELELRPGFAFVSFIPDSATPVPSNVACAGNCDNRLIYSVSYRDHNLVCAPVSLL